MDDLPKLSEKEQALIVVVQRLIAAVMPFRAKHKQDRCYCGDCNALRRELNRAAKTIQDLQPTEL